MPTIFAGISTALRALMAQQSGMQTTAHNIANANTPGFTRQQALMAASTPFPMPGFNRPGGPGQIGTGVDITLIRRIRDLFLDGQVRVETGSAGHWEITRDTLERVEVVFMEPSESGLNSLMGRFWNSWQELSKNAESTPVRTTVRETGIALSNAIRHTFNQLYSLKNDLDLTLENKVREINTLARQIADLNVQIANIQQSGHQPNDLKDQRDVLLDHLAMLVPFALEDYTDAQGNYIGAVKVKVAGQDLVVWGQGMPRSEQVRELQVVEQGGRLLPRWSEVDGTAPLLEVSSGQLAGVLFSRDSLVQNYMDKLDVLARGLIDRINQVHSQGFDLDGNSGGAFFTGTGAADMAVDPLLAKDVRLIAASSGGGPGDSNNALQILLLRSTRMVVEDGVFTPAPGGAGGTTFDNFYKDFIAELGVATHEARRMAENQQALVDQLQNRRDSISGVSLDEETAKLIQYQRAYQAAARVITTIDEMLDTLVNGLKR
ncbi:MAG: flagellar hook-associated protein FlgK [Bacillota bacterium]